MSRIALSICVLALTLTHSDLLAQKAQDRTGNKSRERDFIQVKVRGKLNAEVLAIGGETTGIVISSRDVTWELDFGENKEMRSLAQALNGSTVVVTGELELRRGVEIRQRWIVMVDSLAAADKGKGGEPRGGGDYLDEGGRLRHDLILKDSQSGFAGESGSVLTIKKNGEWQLQTFLNANVRDPEKQGELSATQLKKLAETLEKAKWSGLPKQLGKDPGVNPHVVSVRFGERKTAMKLRGGESVPEADREQIETADQRFAFVVRAVQSLVAE